MLISMKEFLKCPGISIFHDFNELVQANLVDRAQAGGSRGNDLNMT
jgi:hypothetical protein